MKFLRLPDPLVSVLFEDDDIIAVDKPYGFNSHTNDSKIEHSEFIQDGLIEIFEKQRGQKLHIIHRLDQTTTGVIIFGKSVDSAKKYAEYFFNRLVKKTYLFVTAATSKQDHFLIDEAIVHKGRELDAETELQILKRSSRFELWQANPHTGRNHQIRLHAKAAGISILGDPKYDGAPFTFLCLHNHRIEFPNGIVIFSTPPSYFDDLKLLEDRVMAEMLFECDRRQRLFSEVTFKDQCFRLIQGTDFSVDHFGSQLVVNWQREHFHQADRRRLEMLSSLMKKPVHVRHGKLPSLLLGDSLSKPTNEATVWTACEDKAIYEFSIEGATFNGVLLNQRLQRHWLRQNSKDKSVLNLFAQNGSYGLSAGLGGAKDVVCVESSKSAIHFGRRNLELNGLTNEQVKLFCRDSLTYLKQAQQKKLAYDIVVCDIPSFFRGEKANFKIESDLQSFLISLLSILSVGGRLLFSVSSEQLFIPDIKKIILSAQRSAKITGLSVDFIEPSFDFSLPDEKVRLKSFLLTKLT